MNVIVLQRMKSRGLSMSKTVDQVYELVADYLYYNSAYKIICFISLGVGYIECTCIARNEV